MIKPKDLTCRHCVNSAIPGKYELGPIRSNRDHPIWIWCRLGPCPNRVDPDYWCKQGYWIINKTDDTGKISNHYYSREDLFFVSNVEGELVDPWKE